MTKKDRIKKTNLLSTNSFPSSHSSIVHCFCVKKKLAYAIQLRSTHLLGDYIKYNIFDEWFLYVAIFSNYILKMSFQDVAISFHLHNITFLIIDCLCTKFSYDSHSNIAAVLRQRFQQVIVYVLLLLLFYFRLLFTLAFVWLLSFSN